MTETETRAPAPGTLHLVQQFINSNEMPDGVDELRTAPLASGVAAAHDRGRADRVREGSGAARRHPRGDARSSRGTHWRERRSGRGCEIGEAARPRAAPSVPQRGGRHARGRLPRGRQLPRDDLDGDRRGDPHGHLAAPQGLPERLLPLGVLRPVQERLQLLVLDARLRFAGEGTDIPSQTAARRSATLPSG